MQSSVEYGRAFSDWDGQATGLYYSDGVDPDIEVERSDEFSEWVDLALRQVMAEKGGAVVDLSALSSEVRSIVDKAFNAGTGAEWASQLVRLSAVCNHAVVRAGLVPSLSVSSVTATSGL